MKRLLCAIVVLALGVCASAASKTRVSTELQAEEFNNVSSRYTPKPTSVSIIELKDGTVILSVCMDTYAKSQVNPLGKSYINFARKHISEYVAAIDKYLEWAALAIERKDSFTKKIGLVPTHSNIGNGSLKFTFHSGNNQEHFLAIALALPGVTMDEQAHYYDMVNAKELRRLLIAWSLGTLQQTDIDSVYK